MDYQEVTLGRKVEEFLQEAERRIQHFQNTENAPGFVPSDHRQLYQALHYLTSTHAAPGNLFCEWGSGFGVAACLAAMVGLNATGIEINQQLVHAAQQLAADFDLDVEFHCDSFIPQGSEKCFDTIEASGWLTTQAGSIREETGVSPDNFDVIFVYPWPGEERVVEKLFERFAGSGALLMTFLGREGVQLHRKVAKTHRSKSRRKHRH